MSKKKRWEKPRPKALKQPADEKTDSRIIAVAKGCCAGTYGMQAMTLQDAQLLYDGILRRLAIRLRRSKTMITITHANQIARMPPWSGYVNANASRTIRATPIAGKNRSTNKTAIGNRIHRASKPLR